MSTRNPQPPLAAAPVQIPDQHQWTWVVVLLVALIIVIVVAGAIAYYLSSRGRPLGPLLPIRSRSTPLQPVTPALPINPEPSTQERLPDGRYRIRWHSPTGPFVSAVTGSNGVSRATLVNDPKAATVWTFTSTDSSYAGGGQLTTPSSVGMSTGNAWVLPAPVLVQGSGVPLTALQSWAPTRGVGADGSVRGGALRSVAYGGACARPSGGGVTGDTVTLYPDCNPGALEWHYEPAAA